MLSLTNLFAPAALLAANVADIPAPAEHPVAHLPGPSCSLAGEEAKNSPPVVGQEPRLVRFRQWQVQLNPQQTQVQQRVIIRISPARPRSTPLPPQMPRKVVEQKMGKCVGLKNIIAVQTRGANDLVLYTRDRQMISAQLEKKCSARDFYSGFYVEPSKDGNLCVKRDKLQSRNGTKCEIAKFARLVAA